MPASITISKDALHLSLGELGVAVADRDGALKNVGELMRASITQTFRDEGSPAGSWPQLAASTKRNKKYTAGHKLLILSGRLFGSITYQVGNGQLVIGTDVKYAGVHQRGSGGTAVNVSAFDALRVRAFRAYGIDRRKDKNGVSRNLRVRAQGPDNAARFKVKGHARNQNIPARPFLVFRPEDPAKLVSGIEAYLRGRSKAVTA